MNIEVCGRKLKDTIPHLIGFRNRRTEAMVSIFLKVLDEVDFTRRTEQLVKLSKKELNVEGIAKLSEPFYYTYEDTMNSFVVVPFAGMSTSEDDLFIQINKHAYPFLKALKEYNENYDLAGMMTSNYKYTNMIYAYLQDQLKTNPSESIDIRLDKLKAMCDVEEAYKLFTTFKQRVLEPAVKDIMRITGWNITLVFNRGYYHDINEISFMISRPEAH